MRTFWQRSNTLMITSSRIFTAQKYFSFGAVGSVFRPLVIISLIAATALSNVEPLRQDGCAQSRANLQPRVQVRSVAADGAVSPASKAVFNEVKSRLVAVANRHPRYQPDQYVWPPPIELTASPEFEAYACRCYERADRSFDIPK